MSIQAHNLNQAILAAMQTHANKTCFRIKTEDHYHDISYHQFQTLTLRLAGYLQTQGIANGERVALAAENCLEWMVVYMATLLVGGVAVPLRSSCAPNTLQFTLQDSTARLVVLDDDRHGRFISAAIESGKNQLPDLQIILVIGISEEIYPKAYSLTKILNDPLLLTPEKGEAIQAQARNTPPETLVSIHYTAGETGRLKGAVFDQARVLKSMQNLAAWFTLNEEDVAFTIETWSFAPSLAAALYYFLAGVPNVLCEADDKVIADSLQQTSPTVTLNSPYFFERFYDHLMDEVAHLPEATQTIFHWAVAKGKEFQAAGSEAPAELREAYTRADSTFFSQIRGKVGGRMKRMYSIGAPLPPQLADFFAAINLPVLNIYSLTEAGGCPAVSRLDAHRPGSCGQVAPGFEIRLAQDGEILIRGETVMNEYWGWPPEMRQIFDDEGWLHSGDIGHFDDEGYLYLTGRKQSWMMLSTGRKFMPGALEQALMADPYIHQAVILGEGWPYISALIVPDLTAIAQHFQEAEASDDTTDNEEAGPGFSTGSLKWFWHPENEDCDLITTTAHPRVKTLLDKAVEKVNSRLDRWEQIKQYSLVEQALSPAANELAKVMPAGRHLISEKYAKQIQSMYPPAPRLEEEEITQVYLSPERMRELLEKERILDAWLEDAGIEFLFGLARTKQIDVPSIVHLCDAAVTIAQMEHEEKPLSTAFIVGDPTRIARVLPGSEIQLLRSDHIRRMRQGLITLAQLVDGLVLGYIVDKHGYVRGIRRLRFDREQYPVDILPGNRLLGPQFRQRAAISQLCDAVVFFVPTGGRQVRVFADGQLVGRYSNGDWSPDNMARIDEVMNQLTGQKKYDQSLVQRILRCAFQMSEENLGAIFIIGNADDILTSSDAPEISHVALIISADIEELSDRELINFAKQDGATVVDVEGQFRGCMILLRPSAETKADIGPGKGARHSSAAKMSAEARCLAITISQDGPITIYDSGKRILSL